MSKNVEQDAQFVAERDADATREKLAEIYATAFLGACDSTKTPLSEALDEYDSFITQICDKYPKFEAILVAPSVSDDEKLRILDEICAATTLVFRNFLKTLARRGRMDMLRAINVACRRLDDVRKGVVFVEITTAVPLDEATKNNLAVKLRKLVGGEPEMFHKVDPNVVGGIIVRVGDVVYDASIATQLNKVRQDIIDRSAHEIQNRRDCFRNPEGN